MNTPVAIFLFNRPDCTRELLAALSRVRPPVLFVVADGPRDSRPGDVEACAAVRRAIDERLDWPCEVRRHFADRNLGCGRRVSSGLDWVFSQVERAIVLEDDCIPEARFFDFCAELLDRYATEPRVGVIAGSNFQPGDVTGGAGCYFSRYPHCWGWATWRRAWQAYDHAMADWPAVKRSGWLGTVFESAREARYWESIFDRVHAGRIDSWAYRWTYACWRRGFLTALPATNLVTNIGFGADATHTRQPPPMRVNLIMQPWPLQVPAEIVRHAEADAHTAREVFGLRPWTSRVVRKLTAMFR